MELQLEHVQEKLEQLSPDQLEEVDDFIDFLQYRDQDKRLREDFSRASETAFKKVWDNNEDAVYDTL